MEKFTEMLKSMISTSLDKYIVVVIVIAACGIYLTQVLDGLVPSIMALLFAAFLLKLFARKFDVQGVDGLLTRLIEALLERLRGGK